MELRILVIAISIALFSFLESWKPSERGQSIRGKSRNLLYITLYLVLGYFFSLLLFPVTHWAQSSTTVINQTKFIPFILVFIFIGDLLFYFYHRAQHTYPSLWAIHELHHTERELNVTSSLRTHFLEAPIQAMLITSPAIFLLQPPLFMSVIFTVLLTFWLFFTHANLRLNLKSLTKVITGPQVHRIHHSIEERHRNKNFAQFFPIIDIVFGTYYHPQTNEFPKTGLADKEEISFKESLLQPFTTWIKMIY
jgi:sterol desaturase/sphingolipid hydroxylase (fatty acid hydroxylase superfamily)